MTVRNSISGGRPASTHTARLFDTDESRTQAVAAFLAEGYQRGEPLVVLSRPRAWADIETQLATLGIPAGRAIAQKRLVLRDAAETLNKISHHDGPSASLFDGVVGSLVRTAAKGGTVRAYGALVDILGQRGEFDLALRLEGLWNTLSRQVSLTLLCGYCSAHFVSAGTEAALSDICAAHDRVETEPQDQLGAWLLGNAGIRPARA